MKTSYEPKTKKVLKIKPLELVFYVVAGLLLLWGLGETIVGAIAITLPSNNPLCQADIAFKGLFGLNMIFWGIVLMVMGATIFVTVLVLYARTSDRDFEKSQRRAARLAKDNVSSTTIDAKVEEVK